jgi:predicted PurR-regulated permease PerM
VDHGKASNKSTADSGMSERQRYAINPARAFLLLLIIVVTLAFAWVTAPFSGAILWGVVATLLFDPLNQRLLRAMPKRRNTTASITLVVIVGVVIVPAILLSAALVREAGSVYARLRSGDIDLGRTFVTAEAHLPDWMRAWLQDVGLGDIDGVRSKLGQGLANSFQTILAQTVNLGQGALSFFVALTVMLYLTFFLLRDGRGLATRVGQAIPLPPKQRDALIERFVAVIRATIRGSLVIAILQGSIGGITFWLLGIPSALLWGMAMGVFSLFPALGTGLIWIPVTIYLLATGSVWQGIVLGLCGFFVIGTVDNIVRPILVGRDARMPDYIVLVSTMGGFELMGFNGFIVGPLIAGLFIVSWDIFSPPPRGGAALGE